MDDKEFSAVADATLAHIEAALENCGADLDCEPMADGILEVEFADGSKIVINRHSVAREIWVAAKSGGFHFRFDGTSWRDTRDQQELFAKLSQLVGTQSGVPVQLS